jgi:hypothetical protein
VHRHPHYHPFSELGGNGLDDLVWKQWVQCAGIASISALSTTDAAVVLWCCKHDKLAFPWCHLEAWFGIHPTATSACNCTSTSTSIGDGVGVGVGMDMGSAVSFDRIAIEACTVNYYPRLHGAVHQATRRCGCNC